MLDYACQLKYMCDFMTENIDAEKYKELKIQSE